ncbi:MAG: DUF3035 domain-containing protein [Alphaproteobacteria bacterium]
MKTKAVSLLLVAILALGGCSSAKDKLGLTKKSPDEFAVVKRAPLSMPPNYSLRPPTPGAPRPQEQSPEQEARQTVFGQDDATYETQATGNDAAFLNKAGAVKSDPGIRQKVDSETATLAEQERPVVKRILGMDGQEQAPTSVVNAKEEAERLKSNKEKGKPVTEGETPSVEQ